MVESVDDVPRFYHLLYHFDLRFVNFLISVSEKAEKFSFDLWQILKVPNFLGCDL